MSFPNVPHTTASAIVESIIADGNDIANKIESVIGTDPNAEAYGFPAANVHKIAATLRLNAMLAQKLLEENRQLHAGLKKVAEKYNIDL